MNATEARELANTVSSQEQQSAIKTALDKIKWEAERGCFGVTLFPSLDWVRFVKLHLESLGYTVKLTNSSDQRDGPTLEVKW